MRATVLTPLALERAALTGVLTSSRLITTGRGRRRSLRLELSSGTPSGPSTTGDTVPNGRSGPVIVAGVAGGLGARVRPGDLVVADELRWADHSEAGEPVRLPSAQLLAGALRRLGLRVHVGPVYSSETIVHGERRRELAATGALAVDQESAWLARQVLAQQPGTPLAVVRAIVDTDDRPLLRAGTVTRSLSALRSLRRAAPAIEAWAAAAGESRQVVLAAPRSFCAGVERAIEVVERTLDRYGTPVYVRRQIVHNTQVVRELTERGAVFVQEADEVPRGAVMVLAAHGVSPQVRRQAAERELTVVDGTCPLVSKVHAEVRRFARRGETVLLIGHRDHEEVVGTVGEAPDSVIVVENAEQARIVQPRDPNRVAYVTQTTLARQDAESVLAELGPRFGTLSAPSSEDICFATTNRQQAVQAIAADVDLILVLGSANSSNSRRLVEVAEQAGRPALLIDEAAELDLRLLAGVRRIGITAGASAPPDLVDQLIDNLTGLGPVAVREHRVTTEDVTFSLPPGVS